MKVLHLSSEATWRGGEQQIVYLVEETEHLGCESIIACKEGSAVERYCQVHGISHFSVPFRSAYDPRTLYRLFRFCRREKFDIIHSHTSKSFTMAVLLGVLGVKSPQVTTRRVNVPIKPNWFSRFKYNYSLVEKIICISNAVSQITEVKDPSRKVIVSSGIDLGKFAEYQGSNYLHKTYGLPHDTVCVGNTSALTEVKDYPTFIAVAEQVVKQFERVHFFVVGEGEERSALEQMVRDKGLQDYVTFTGFVENIKEVVPALNVFLFTSKSEGLGTSVLDAMVAGVAVISTRSGGVNDMIRDAENGLLYDVGDVAGLSQGLMRILTNPEEREAFVRQASSIAQEFSKQKTAEKTVSIYKDILGIN